MHSAGIYSGSLHPSMYLLEMKRSDRETRDSMIKDLVYLGYSQVDISKHLRVSTQWINRILYRDGKNKKVQCYCPACGRDKLFYIEVDRYSTRWTGQGIYPHFCEKHKKEAAEARVDPYIVHYKLKDYSEKSIIQTLTELD